MHARTARAASIGLAAGVALLAATGASADDPSAYRNQADSLRSANADLASRTRSAVLELYALQSKLARAEQRVAALRARSAEVERARQEAARHLQLVRSTLARAQNQLADRLRALYVEGDPDPLAVLLGARSLDEALTALDSLDRLAHQDRKVVDQVQSARREVKAALAALGAQQRRLATLTAGAESARNSLAAAEGERAGYLSDLRRRQRLNASEIARLTDAAAAAEQKAEELAAAQPAPPSDSTASAPAPTATPAPTSSETSGGRTLTVVATGYSLRGTTATGVPTGWGVVAVDPSVIPLGTKMTIPGYGDGFASDTGSAVKGNIIDLWFPTRAQALAWGRRTVTISLH